MTRRYSRPVAVALVTLLALAGVAVVGCNASGPSASAIATVNGVEIPKSAVDDQVNRMKTAQPASFEGTAGVAIEQQYRAQVLSGLIDIELIKEAATTLGVSVTTQQIDDYVAQLQTQYGGAPALDTAMKTAGFTMDSLREQISVNLLRDAVSSKVTTGAITVTDAQIKTYYDANTSQFATPAQVHAEHILFATTDKATAQTVLAQVKAGGDFAALAKKYSTDPGSAATGGDLGWAAPSAYVTEFANAVNAMAVNDVRLVETQYGWHIIKLLGRRAAAKQTLAEATAQIRTTLESNARSEKFGAYVDDLRAKATIKYFDADLQKIIEANKALSSTATTASANTTN
ncbi:MAG TPA: peptidylprolyl isomerase [Coriobacteriia bacterium]